VSAVEVREARDAAELRAAVALRHAVFVDEQRVPPELELDGHDDEAAHLVAVQEGRVLATARLLPRGGTVLLGRLAVVPDARRRGLATALLRVAEAWARDEGAARIVLSAQTYARALYEAAGYEARGAPYEEAGIMHLQMERDLA
jgi:predicted GNAT family N-acyltransferase